ncbi:hypothetical protein FCV25MIE_14783 [Fagus crenata]
MKLLLRSGCGCADLCQRLPFESHQLIFRQFEHVYQPSLLHFSRFIHILADIGWFIPISADSDRFSSTSVDSNSYRSVQVWFKLFSDRYLLVHYYFGRFWPIHTDTCRFYRFSYISGQLNAIHGQFTPILAVFVSILSNSQTSSHF